MSDIIFLLYARVLTMVVKKKKKKTIQKKKKSTHNGTITSEATKIRIIAAILIDDRKLLQRQLSFRLDPLACTSVCYAFIVTLTYYYTRVTWIQESTIFSCILPIGNAE